MKGGGNGRAPIRIKLVAEQTVQLRPYESARAVMGVELDAGTSRKEVVDAIADADVIYEVLREKVSARAFEAKVQAKREDEEAQAVPVVGPKVGKGEWTRKAAPAGARGSAVRKR